MYIQLENFGNKSSLKSMYYEGKYECIERIHQFPEIVCVLEGSVEITVDGVKEEAKAGDLAVITPFRIHSFKTPDRCKIWIGVVSNDFASDFLFGEKIYISGKAAVFTPTKSLFAYLSDHLPPKYDSPIVIEGDQQIYKSIKAIVYAVLEEYSRFVPQVRVDLKNTALASVLLYMSEHFASDISLESVAKALGYSPTHISRCISVIPNMNFRKLLNSLRVDQAKIGIIKGEGRMIDIAVECGFSCERSFNRAFLEITGMTPTQYRKGNALDSGAFLPV